MVVIGRALVLVYAPVTGLNRQLELVLKHRMPAILVRFFCPAQNAIQGCSPRSARGMRRAYGRRRKSGAASVWSGFFADPMAAPRSPRPSASMFG